MFRGIRTDMALEARQLHREVRGVTEKTETRGSTSVNTIEIRTEEAAQKIGKPVGTYVTVEEPGIAMRSPDAFRSATDAASAALSGLIRNAAADGTLLVIGLGNRNITADSLGPAVVSKVFVTRHIKKAMPDADTGDMREVAAAAPGVLGVTGMETLEVVRGLVREIAPKAILCIDALASLRASRISTSIQINDSGVSPGAGVGNRRQGIDRGTLGLPVFAIGVPTVVHAHTIVAETVAKMSSAQGRELDALTGSIAKTMDELYGEMVVTTKDVDQMIADSAGILAEAINRALFGARYAEIEALLS